MAEQNSQISTRIFGEQQEEKAASYLKQHGLELIEHNFQCKCGEIDLIMRDQDYLVFVEVRFRKRDKYGDGADSVTPNKQRKIIRTAKFYLQQKKLYGKCPCRFDVVSVKNKENNNKYHWIKDAFWVE
ncbi:MAG: YraN family protein [Gammaproteobacteria bacterium]|nr:YraN family protein [Gammaproteobacteria bacterium]